MYSWRNSFVHVGVTRGVDVSGNAMINPGAGAAGAGAAPDMVFYSNAALARSGNSCYGRMHSSGINSSAGGDKRHCSVALY